MERVYHYTTMNAFLKLIESIMDSSDKKSLVFWATNIFFMNDPLEFIYGQGVLLDVLKEIEYEKRVEYDLRLSSLFSNHKEKTEEEWLHKLLDGIRKQNESPYVISFSRNMDSLPMWLNYGDNGKGVCLAFAEYRSKFVGDGFNPNEISDTIVEIFDSLGTHDIRYDKFDDKTNPLRKNIDYMYEYYLEKAKAISPEQFQELQIGMLRGLTIVHAPYIKTKDYEGEREVRLAKTIKNKGGLSEIKYRCNTKGNIVPYIDVEIPISQLDYIIIGPLANQELSKSVIEMMKNSYGLNFDIKESKIQYRDY